MITKSKIIAIMAVMCLAFAGVAVAVSDNDIVAENEKYITVTYDGVIDSAVAQKVFNGTVTYEAILDEEKLDSVLNYEAYQLLKNAEPTMITGTKITVPVNADAKYLDAAKKVGVDGSMKTIVKTLDTGAEKDTAVALYSADSIVKAVENAKKGLFTQEQLDKAVADAKVGMYTKEQLDKAVADAKVGLFTQEQVDKAVADALEKNKAAPFYETTMGQIAIILAIFAVVLIVYYNFDAIKTKFASLKGVKP